MQVSFHCIPMTPVEKAECIEAIETALALHALNELAVLFCLSQTLEDNFSEKTITEENPKSKPPVIEEIEDEESVVAIKSEDVTTVSSASNQVKIEEIN